MACHVVYDADRNGIVVFPGVVADQPNKNVEQQQDG